MLLIAIGAWAASYWGGVNVFREEADRESGVWLSRGTVLFVREVTLPRDELLAADMKLPPDEFYDRPVAWSVNPWPPIDLSTYWPVGTRADTGALGFRLVRGNQAGERLTHLYTPCWAWAATFAGTTWAALRRVRRSRRSSRAAQGRCAGCDYDLRAGHERCPECGLPTPAAQACRAPGPPGP